MLIIKRCCHTGDDIVFIVCYNLYTEISSDWIRDTLSEILNKSTCDYMRTNH